MRRAIGTGLAGVLLVAGLGGCGLRDGATASGRTDARALDGLQHVVEDAQTTLDQIEADLAQQ